MSQIIGEAWVKVRPIIAGFAGELEAETGAAAARAGAVSGREFGAGFQSQSHVGATVRRELGDAERGAAAATFRFTGLGRAAAYASGTFLAAGGLVEGLKASVGAAAALEGNLAVADKAVTNAGASNTAYGKTVEELIRTQALQKGFSEGELLPSFTRLESATHNTRKAYNDLVLAEDVARARHIQVTVAALALSKAEQGSVTSLQRLGVILPASAAGLDRHAKALLANEILLRRFGGSAASYASTGAGALARLGEAGHVIEETVGAAALPQVEKIAIATARWASNSENLAKVQRDAATVVKDLGSAVSFGAAAVHDASAAYHDLEPAIHGVNTLLGGTRNSVRLLAAAFVVSKLGLLPGIFQAIRIGVSQSGAAAATSAGEFNALASAEARAGVGGAAGAAGAATKLRTAGGFNTFTPVAEGGAAAAAAKGIFGRGVGGVIGGAGLILPGLNQDSRSSPVDYKKAFPFSFQTPQGQTLLFETKAKRDAYVEAYNARYSLPAANAATAPRESNPRNLPGLATATTRRGPRTDVDYAISVQRALLTQSNADELALYTGRAHYLDERIATMRKDANLSAVEKKTLLRLETERLSLQNDITSITQTALGRTQQLLSRASTVAGGTVSLADDRAAAANLLTFYRKQAANTKLTADQRSQYADQAAAAQAQILQSDQQLYQQAKTNQEADLQLQGQRAALTIDNAKDDRAAEVSLLAFYRREANDAKLAVTQRRSYQQQAAQQQLAIVQLDRASYRTDLQTRETRLQLNVQRAQLTANSTRDDKKALRALIAFYNREAHDAKLSQAERLQFQSQAIQSRIALKGLTVTGTTAADIFHEAAQEFRAYGSNIAGRGGVLSGQDARARLASRLLGGTSAQSLAVIIARQHAQRDQQALTEAQKQTALLRDIARGLGATSAKKAGADAIRAARQVARVVAG